MTGELQDISEKDEAAYRDMLDHCRGAMFTHSFRYLRFLERVLPKSKPRHIVYKNHGRIEGAFPAVTQERGGVLVVNSLPFFGSHGGLVLRPDSPPEVKEYLSQGFKSIVDDVDHFSSTVIESPLEHLDQSRHFPEFSFADSRVGQVTEIAEEVAGDYSREKLLALFEKRTRNSATRALRSGLLLGPDDSSEALDSLFSLHVENMESIGGTTKPQEFPSAVRDVFKLGTDYRVFSARSGSDLVAGLLVFYFKDWVEYFMPATHPDYRVDQPMSGLVLLAMEDAVQRGFRKWNWGGTWATQRGVYRFKRGFGAIDCPYRYFTQLSEASYGQENNLMRLRRDFPFFYIAPQP